MSDQQSRLPQLNKDDDKADSLKSGPVIAIAAGVSVGSDAHYEAIWNESEKVRRRNQQDRAQLIKMLKRELNSDGGDGISRYFSWAKKTQLKPPNPISNPFELFINLHMANWFEANEYLLHLNSLLSLDNCA